MTDETLKKANNYKKQIDELSKFTYDCRNCWKILKLCSVRFKLRTAYGMVSNEIEVSEELADRILKTIDDYTYMLEQELLKM